MKVVTVMDLASSPITDIDFILSMAAFRTALLDGGMRDWILLFSKETERIHLRCSIKALFMQNQTVKLKRHAKYIGRGIWVLPFNC